MILRITSTDIVVELIDETSGKKYIYEKNSIYYPKNNNDGTLSIINSITNRPEISSLPAELWRRSDGTILATDPDPLVNDNLVFFELSLAFTPPAAPLPNNLEFLNDVTIDRVADGNILQYDESSGQWINSFIAIPPSEWDRSGNNIKYPDGNVAVGPFSNFNQRLNVDGNIAMSTSVFNGASNNLGWYVAATPTATASIVSESSSSVGTGLADRSYMAFHTTGSNTNRNAERMRIDHDGNVGIGTSTPSEKLHVVGNIESTDPLNPSIKTKIEGNRIYFSRGSNGSYSSNIGTYTNSGGMWMQANQYIRITDGTRDYSTLRSNINGGNGLAVNMPFNSALFSHTISAYAEGDNMLRLYRADGLNNPELQINSTSDSINFKTDGSTSNTEISWSQGLSERMRIDADGKVGIGTDDPSYGLHLISGNGFKLTGGLGGSGEEVVWLLKNGTDLEWRTNGQATHTIKAWTSSTGAHAYQRFYPSGGETWSHGVYRTDNQYRIVDGLDITNNARLVINGSDGNVGIGTATPESSLHIAGSSGITMGRNSAQNQVATILADVSDNLQLNAGLGLGKYIKIGGNRINVSANRVAMQTDVTIGPQATAGPISGYTLSIRDTAPSIYLKDQTGVVGDGRIHVNNNILSIGVDPDNVTTDAALRFETRASERMRIDHDGNVGIGTAAPSSSLHVKGENDLPDNYALRVGNSTSDNILAIRNDGKIGFFGENNTANKIYIQGSSNEQVFLDSFMRLGWSGGAAQYFKGWSGRITANFGGTESARFRADGLRVRNSIHLGENSGDTGDTRFTRLNTGTVAIGNNADDGSGTLIVGNVGIGTTTPTESLQIGQPATGSSQPDHHILLTGYDVAGIKWNMHNGWSKAKLTSDLHGVISLTNEGAVRKETSFNIGSSHNSLSENEGRVRINNSGVGDALTFGRNGPYPIAAVRVNSTGTAGGLAGGLTFNVREGTTTTHDVLTLEKTGKVGIGTSTPQSKLQVVGNGITASNTGGAAVLRADRTDGKILALTSGLNGSSFIFDSTGFFGIGPDSRTTIEGTTFGTAQSIYINGSNQYVGIGTSTPLYPFHVANGYALFNDNIEARGSGESTFNGSIKFANTGTSSRHTTLSRSGSDFIIGVDNNAHKFTFDGDDGNFGIGTTEPSEKLDVNGLSKAVAHVSNGVGTHPTGIGPYVETYVYNNNTGRLFAFDGASYYDLAIGDWGGGNPNIMLKVGGNVGIGTGTPSQKLEVEGNARINGALQINDPSGTGFALPTADGTSGQVLSTDGSGAVTWVDQSGGGGGASTLNDLTDVLIPSVADGDLLNYNSAFSSWIPVNSISLAGNITSAAIVQGNTGSFTTTTSESYKFVGTGDFSIEPATTLGGDLYIKSNKDIIVEIDTNNNDTPSKFSVVDGTERFSVDDAGVARFNNAFSLPNADGTGGQVLSTNGSGTVSWVDQSQVTASESYRVYATARTQAGGTADVAVGVSVSKSATGTYDYTFDQARPDTSYVVMTTPVGYPLSDSNIYVSNISTTGFTIYCTTGDNGGTDDPLIDNAHSISVIVTDQLDAIKGDQGLSGDAFDVAGEAAGRTLVAADHLKYLRSTSATAVTFTVPPQSSVAWVDNAEVVFEQAGAGQITIAAGAGVTINSSETLKSGQQYAVIGLKRVASDTWTLTGERELA